MLHGITFSIPKNKVIDFIPQKIKILSNLIPGQMNTYIYGNEEDYYNEYRSSIFAITTKKSGWDCMRHYEILANGCIPYFPDIESCPENTMSLLPKNLILEGNKLYEKFEKYVNIIELTCIEYDECINLIYDLLNYTRKYLTTEKIAEYIMYKAVDIKISNILYLSGDTSPDYLRCTTLHGFKEILGGNCHDYPKVPHIYKSNNINYKELYGKGITYTNLLDQSYHRDDFDETIVDDILDKKYDIIIYGSYHRGMPYYDLICSIYEHNKIILLCGEDLHNCNNKLFTDKGHPVFVREL